MVAYWLGDPTAKKLGRLTANPVKHIDPVGTILVPVLLGILTQGKFPFGWAKPVPVDTSQFQSPQKDMALVAIAGPLANLVMAVGWALLFLLIPEPGISTIAYLLNRMAAAGIFINLLFMCLNLLPIPPLDGGRIVMGVMPFSWARLLAKFELIGFAIVILLVIKFDLISKVIFPMAQKFQMILLTLLGI